ncbi:alpha/beta hydrolase [Croceitalea rosinachiae]|uniref:Alpha/beta hydrolase n=1 Tax=Croceitalea rosinachiae TaxID=3075596 RepID=A0ABU3AH77_9FLAO|nr:alpha/beta hydrolase [Croceitalea sp. F388]MDT0608251.1 alpha/beta hydrolase [Croceitalea sp. F388]
MKIKNDTTVLTALAFLLLLPLNSNCSNQMNESNEINAIISNVTPITNIPYKNIDSTSLYLDIYFPSKKLGQDPWFESTNGLKPLIINFHGGGWIEGTRQESLLNLLPYMKKKFIVVNVDYRLLPKTDLKGSLSDCISAINWVTKNLSQYNLKYNKIILTGDSAGGHLALLAGTINQDGMDLLGIEDKKLFKTDAIINWYGITDVPKAIHFWNDSEYENILLKNVSLDIEQYFELLSPIIYVDKNTPSIISIHGDADINVPISQSIKLHEKLEGYSLKNKLITISGKKHGGFSIEELDKVYKNIWKFLGS